MSISDWFLPAILAVQVAHGTWVLRLQRRRHEAFLANVHSVLDDIRAENARLETRVIEAEERS